VQEDLPERLLQRVGGAQRVHPLGGDAAGRRGPLADLVAVDDERPRAGAGELARHREAAEAGPADEHVEFTAQAGPCGSPRGGPHRHRRRSYGAKASRSEKVKCAQR
jgi:hypothetical protein